MSYLKTTKSLAGWGAMLFWTYWYISVWLSKGSITFDSIRSSSQRCCSLSKRFKTSSGAAEISMVVFHNRSGGPSHTWGKLAESVFLFLTLSFSSLFFKNLVETLLHLLVLSYTRSEMRYFFPTACTVTQLVKALHVWVKACEFNTVNIPGLDKQKNTNQKLCVSKLLLKDTEFLWRAIASKDYNFFSNIYLQSKDVYWTFCNILSHKWTKTQSCGVGDRVHTFLYASSACSDVEQLTQPLNFSFISLSKSSTQSWR